MPSYCVFMGLYKQSDEIWRFVWHMGMHSYAEPSTGLTLDFLLYPPRRYDEVFASLG